MFAKILCPIDFSEGSRHALAQAIALAKRCGAELAILHAWELPVFAGGYTVAPAVIEDMTEVAKRELAGAVQLAKDGGVAKVSARDIAGMPWQTIVDVIEGDHAIDLVVMGTHGRTGVRRVLLGSVAEKVIRLSPASVMVVHPEDHIGTFRRVLCPTDLSDPAEYAVTVAAGLVDHTDATLELVHVLELPHTSTQGSHAISMAKDLEQQTEAELERRGKRIATPARVAWRIEVGPIGEQLLGILERDPIDLVVCASHGRTGLARVFLGSVAEKLARHAKCPVLVARRRGAAL